MYVCQIGQHLHKVTHGQQLIAGSADNDHKVGLLCAKSRIAPDGVMWYTGAPVKVFASLLRGN